MLTPSMSIADAINDLFQVNNISDHAVGLALQAVGGSVSPRLFQTVPAAESCCSFIVGVILS